MARAGRREARSSGRPGPVGGGSLRCGGGNGYARNPTCGCRKPAPPGQMLAGRRRLGHANSAWRAGWFELACDDLRLAGLKLIFLIVTRAVSVLGLSRREACWKDAEILMLRRQFAVALREQPRAHSRLTWPDRAWLALLAGALPAGRLARLRLIVTPATILRWHRDIVRRRWARLSRRGRSGRPRCAALCGRWCTGWRRRMNHGGTGGSTVSLPGLASLWRRRHCGAVDGVTDPQERRDRPGAPPGRPWLGGVPAVAGAGDPGAGLLHR